MLSSVSICLLWFEGPSLAVIQKVQFCVSRVHFRMEIPVIVVHLGPVSIRSALLSHSERAQRAAPGLERRPRKNGAGTASQWNRPGNNNKGKNPTMLLIQTIADLTFCHQFSKDIIRAKRDVYMDQVDIASCHSPRLHVSWFEMYHFI